MMKCETLSRNNGTTTWSILTIFGRIVYDY